MAVHPHTSMIVSYEYILCTVITCFFLLCLYLYKAYNYWKDRGIPYDEPYLFFGNIGFIMRKSVWDYCYDLRIRRPEDYFGVFLGWKPVLMVQTAELAKQILTKDFDYFQDRFLYSNMVTDPLGALNLFTVKNPIWKNIRQELTPMFTTMRLKIFTAHMKSSANELVLKIKRDYIDNKKTANLKELFTMYASDNVAYTVFGIHVSVLKGQESPIWFITSQMVKWTFWRGLEFTLIFLTPAMATFFRRKYFSDGATNYVRRMFWNCAETKKSENSNYNDLVNHLLKIKGNFKLPDNAGSQLVDDIKTAQVASFILGSVETSSTVLSYCLHELAYHPEEQEKLYNEITGAVNQNGKDIMEYNELLELKYLSACLNETMRKYPNVPYLERVCQKKYKLNEHVTIEAGVPVFINVISIHYNEKYFPDPEQWRPERFSTALDGDTLNYTFLPFGEGPRVCIGKRYGMMQMRAALAQMILHYKIEPAVPYRVKTDPYSVMLAPENGLSVQFVAR